MKQLNFDSLTHIKTPEEWLEKAAAVPQTEAKRQAIFIPRRFIAAASIVLVGTLGLLAFFLHKDTDGLLMIPDSYPTETQASTDGVKVIGSTENVTVSGTEAIAPTGGQKVPTDAQGQRATEPTVASTAGAGIAATQPTQAAVPPSETAAPTVRPTAPSATQRPTAPPETQRPTELPAPTAPPATQKPTEAYRPPGDTEFYGTFSITDSGTASGSGWNVAEDLTVFCRLYDSSGKLVGDSPLYHPQREATILSKFSDGTIFAYYNPVEKGLSVSEGVYEYVFYDIHDNELYRGIKFVF